jgi:hypothetical protein
MPALLRRTSPSLAPFPLRPYAIRQKHSKSRAWGGEARWNVTGRLLMVIVTNVESSGTCSGFLRAGSAANVQDRDCAAGLIERTPRKYPRLKRIFADGGYAGPKLAS